MVSPKGTRPIPRATLTTVWELGESLCRWLTPLAGFFSKYVYMYTDSHACHVCHTTHPGMRQKHARPRTNYTLLCAKDQKLANIQVNLVKIVTTTFWVVAVTSRVSIEINTDLPTPTVTWLQQLAVLQSVLSKQRIMFHEKHAFARASWESRGWQTTGAQYFGKDAHNKKDFFFASTCR